MVIPPLHFPLLLPAARRNRWSNHPPPLPSTDPCCYPPPRAVVIHIIRQINGQCSILEEVELHQGKTRIPIYLRREMGHFLRNCQELRAGDEMQWQPLAGRAQPAGHSPGLFGGTAEESWSHLDILLIYALNISLPFMSSTPKSLTRP